MKVRSYGIALTMSSLLGVVSCSQSPHTIQNTTGAVGTVGQATQPGNPVATTARALAQAQPETTAAQTSKFGRLDLRKDVRRFS